MASEVDKNSIIEFYDQLASKEAKLLETHGSASFAPDIRSPYTYLEQTMEAYLSKLPKPWKVLDCPCGQGLHSIFPASIGAEVVGVDISTRSIESAQQRAKNFAVTDKTNFILMDCERLEFPEASFDAIYCSGSLYYLDAERLAAEIKRVVKPGGLVVFVESLAENPILNLNRWIKNLRGSRTDYVTKRLLTLEALRRYGLQFEDSQVRCFNLLTFLAVPFRRTPIYSGLLAVLEALDRQLLKLPFFGRLAFKAALTAKVPLTAGYVPDKVQRSIETCSASGSGASDSPTSAKPSSTR